MCWSIEGAIHGMNQLFSAHQTGWGVLLVDAAYAFNSLNRAAMLMHARVLWPRCARFLFNTYRGWLVLVLRGSSTYLFSKKGVTQGDPLSMFMYAIGTLPLIRSLNDPGNCGMLMMLLPVELCQSYVIGLISFVHMVLVLATILNLQKVLSSSVNDGRVMLLQCSAIWEFRW